MLEQYRTLEHVNFFTLKITEFLTAVRLFLNIEIKVHITNLNWAYLPFPTLRDLAHFFVLSLQFLLVPPAIP